MKQYLKTLGVFGWINKTVNELQKLPKHSDDTQFKYLKHTLNSMNAFIL